MGPSPRGALLTLVASLPLPVSGAVFWARGSLLRLPDQQAAQHRGVSLGAHLPTAFPLLPSGLALVDELWLRSGPAWETQGPLPPQESQPSHACKAVGSVTHSGPGVHLEPRDGQA